MHNVRTKWVRLTAPHLKVPRDSSTAAALYAEAGRWRDGPESSARLARKMMAEAFGDSGQAASKKFHRACWQHIYWGGHVGREEDFANTPAQKEWSAFEPEAPPLYTPGLSRVGCPGCMWSPASK